MINVVGIDPSLTHTAGFHALGPASSPEFRAFAIKSSPKDHTHPIARLASIRTALLVELGKCQREASSGLVFVEGYSFGSKNGREALGECELLAKLEAWEPKQRAA